MIIRCFTRPFKINKPNNLSFSLYHSQLFTSSSLQYSSSSRNPPRRRIDREITSEWIQLVDPTFVLDSSSDHSPDQPTNKSLLEPSRTQDVLSRLDLSQYALIEVNRLAKPPICKLIKRNELSPIRNRRINRPTRSLSLKEIQISNLIEPNDLETKLRLINLALEKGHRVRISITLNSNGPHEFSENVEERMIEIGAEKIKEEREGRKLLMDWAPGKSKKKKLN